MPRCICRFNIISIIALACFFMPVIALAAEDKPVPIPPPTEDFYFNDYANVLGDSLKKEIMINSPALDNYANTPIIVLTVNTLYGLTPEAFARDVCNTWGINNNYVLILISTEEGEAHIEVSQSLKNRLTEGKIVSYIDHYAMDYYLGGNFNPGTRELYRAILSEVLLEYDLEPLAGYEPLEDSKTIFSNLTGIVGTFLIAVIVFLSISQSRKKRNATNKDKPLGNNDHGGFYGGGHSPFD